MSDRGRLGKGNGALMTRPREWPIALSRRKIWRCKDDPPAQAVEATGDGNGADFICHPRRAVHSSACQQLPRPLLQPS